MSLVLVTGGAGFIGSHLCEGLLKEGYRVRVLDNLSTGKRENIPSGAEFIQGSILNERDVQQAVQDVTHICHNAAVVTIRGSVERFYDDAETNLMGTLKLLRSVKPGQIQRFIFASSMAVYADSEQPVPVSEKHSPIPASPYGVAKLASEQYVCLVAPGLGIEPVVLRYFNTFGTRQAFTPYVGVITIFVTRMLRGEPVTVFGDGRQVRDFVHVSDIVQSNILALKSDRAPGGIFNVGSGRGTSVLDLFSLLQKKLGMKAEIQFEPVRSEEIRNSIAGITKAETILGYRSKTDISTQIDEVIQSLRSR